MPTRRETLQALAWLGAGGGVASVLGAVPRSSRAESAHPIVPYRLDDPELQTVASCAGCGGGCSIRAARAGSVVGKIDGNPWSPRQAGSGDLPSARVAATRRGTSCARGQARVNNVHDPWRLKEPMLRDGARGSGRFRRVTPEEWLAAVLGGADGGPGLVGLHEQARGGSGPPRVVVAVDPRHQDRRPVLEALGRLHAGLAPILGHPAPELARATERILGQPGFLAAPRWDRAALAVAWGADPVATGLDPVGSARALVGRRDRLIAVDPRLSSTGALAGTWLPVRPGGDALLAAWVLRRWAEQGLVPGDAAGAISGRSVDRLEHATGLGADLVDELADRIRVAGPAFAVAIGSGLSPDAADAVLALAAWAGALDPGGAMEPTADPIPAIDGPRALRERLTSDAPPDVVIAVGDATRQDGSWHEPLLALLADPGRVKRVVWIGAAPGAILRAADAFLPDLTEVERLGVARRHDGTSVTVPAIDPVPVGPAGLEGLADALAAAIGSGPIAASAFVQALEVAAAGSAPLSVDDEQVLTAALAGRVPDLQARSASARALLLRGWTPPAAGGSAPKARRGPIARVGDGEEGLVLVPFSEPFGGQADSDAQVWASRAVRTENEAWVHPGTLDALPGADTGRVRLAAGSATAELPVRRTHEIRPGCVGLARGYGQRFGYSGDLVVDGVALPAAPRRCDGVAVSPLLGAPLAMERAPELPRESLLAQLIPGGHRETR